MSRVFGGDIVRFRRFIYSDRRRAILHWVGAYVPTIYRYVYNFVWLNW